MTNLPQGWEVKKLGDIAEIQIGKTPSRNNIDFFQGENIWLSIRDLKSKFVSSSSEKISNEAISKTNMKVVPKGTLLMSFKLTLGKTAFAECDLYTNEAIAAIFIKNKNINKYFLDYVLKFTDLEKYVDNAVKGKTLNKQKLKQIEILLPKNIKEQERIVGILDESFAKIDESIKILEQDLLNLDELMQSALQKAFNPLKDNVKENYKLPQSWEWKSLGEIGEIITGTTPSKNNPNFYGNEYPLFKPSDLNGDIIIKYASDNLSKLGFDNARNLPKDTILVVCIGASIGKVGLSGVNGSCNQQINAIIPNSAFTSKYLFFVCLSNYFQTILKKNASQTTLPIINKTEFSKLQIPLPPIKEQEQITSHLDELSSHVKNLKQNYQAQIKDLQELKNSLLDKAFKGNL
ncbi:restriction endonuclease subunit S [Campylobacter coli]|uniref:restriction endonuclease subunit S n=1 Tax=Campylobacter coli TaxID=195 RepID=UPI0001E178A2|nr:restriction endonuclease subunit S [Campylobacter coli]EAK8217868.1 restriction endonuclease subunit S [Campylobacter coli]EAL0558368.1 restriction endonuclease subunit S [Campylobacter coli]EFM37341.1 type I restriction modification DNA specificity domain protein [Campylobacter coli JV20]EHH9695577.1 restriction endonuclease subunit S [Campylobacter coli]QGS20564.1 restriction endonuclease subunit S [Campylobacter coli]